MAWSTAADSVTYNAARPGRTTWAALSGSEQAQWLTVANDILIHLEGYSYPDTVADDMKSAEIEQAWSMYNMPSEVSEVLPLIEAGVTRYHINQVDVYLDGSKKTPEISKRVLSYLFRYKDAGTLGPGRASSF